MPYSPPASRLRTNISMAAIGVVLALLFVLVPNVVLLSFAGLLFAAFLHSGAGLVRRGTGLGAHWSLAAFTLLLILATVILVIYAVPRVNEQVVQLSTLLPQAYDSVTAYLQSTYIGQKVIEQLSVSQGIAMSAVGKTFNAVGNVVLVLFVGVYVAINPGIHRRGLELLFAPPIRKRADEALVAAAVTVRKWLVGQLIAMAVVGGLTGLGLVFLGVPLAGLLGLITAMLTFIPTLGPVLSAIPSMLMAFTVSPTLVIWVVGLYVIVQSIESYLVTPMVQQEQVSLPPALVIGMQFLFGALFGILGLMIAAPMTAVGMRLIQMLYIHDFLEQGGPKRPVAPRE